MWDPETDFKYLGCRKIDLKAILHKNHNIFAVRQKWKSIGFLQLLELRTGCTRAK